MPDVDATTKSPPACPEQLLTRQTMRARLFESERTFGQLRRNTRSRRHAKNAGRCAAYEQRRPLTPSVRSVGYQGAAIANVAHTRRLSWSGRRASNPSRPRSKRAVRIQELRTDAHRRAPTRTPVGVSIGVKL